MDSETPFIVMTAKFNNVPFLVNLLASFCFWLILAGFDFFSDTFASLKQSKSPGENKTARYRRFYRLLKPLSLLRIIGELL